MTHPLQSPLFNLFGEVNVYGSKPEGGRSEDRHLITSNLLFYDRKFMLSVVLYSVFVFRFIHITYFTPPLKLYFFMITLADLFNLYYISIFYTLFFFVLLY